MGNSVVNPNKQIAKNTLYLYIRMLITMVVTLFTSRIVLAQLGVVDYGVYNVVGGLVISFSYINSSLASSSSRFLSYELGKGVTNELNRVFCMSLNIHYIFGAIVFILAESLGLWILGYKLNIPEGSRTAAFVVYQLCTLSSIFNILAIPYNSLIIAHEKMSAFAYISIVEVILKFGAALLLYISWRSKLTVYGISLFVISIIVRSIYIFYCKRKFRNDVYYKRMWDKGLFKNMIGFSTWAICLTTSSTLVNEIVNILLNIFVGPVVNAARGVAVAVQGSLSQFVTNFQVALNPQITKNYAAENLPRCYQLILVSSKLAFMLLFLIAFPILVNINFILKIWLVEVPENTAIIIVLVTISSLFYGMANPFGVSAEATNRIKTFSIWISLLNCLNLPISYVLLRCSCPVALVFAVPIVINVVGYFLKLLLSHNVIGMPYMQELILLLKVVVVVVISTAMVVIFNLYEENGFSSFAITFIICFVYAGLIDYYVILSSKEREYFKAMALNKIQSICRGA